MLTQIIKNKSISCH